MRWWMSARICSLCILSVPCISTLLGTMFLRTPPWIVKIDSTEGLMVGSTCRETIV